MDGKRKNGCGNTPVHIGCMCYVSCMLWALWAQHDVVNGLFVQSSGNDAE